MTGATGGAADPAVLSGPAPIFHRVMNATLDDIRRALVDLRDRFHGRADADALGRLELVLAEVLNNIALHGVNGLPAKGALGPTAGAQTMPVIIHLTVTGHCGGLACAVIDDGTPLPERCLVPTDGMPAPEVSAMRAGGFGWFIIRDLTRSLFYFREESRNVLCFNIPRRGARRGRPAAGAA